MGPEDFDYPLPESAVAQIPLTDRASARLLDATGTSVIHRTVRDLPNLLRPGDVLVLNDTRVLHARLLSVRPTGGSAEVLLLRPVKDDALEGESLDWEALVRPSRKVEAGTRLVVSEGLVVEVQDDLGEGRRRVRPMTRDGIPMDRPELLDALDHYGMVPLPPYLTQGIEDPERYQTVYSERSASAAAPTAGLHLTEAVLEACQVKGVQIERLELVVGLDTFRPVVADDFDDHRMHKEAYRVPAKVIEACMRARAAGGRVVAVGTTTVRALESAARFGPDGETDLFIRPPFDFQMVNVLMTNYHLPRSTLLVMLEAFVGSRWRDLYATALDAGYRFLSFGDAMLVSRGEEQESSGL
ncbi:MAG TPA: tRNA preQ1(34) S-adenosylmethionine ribosyltransferase-isomerase QueA [Acidimicrobiaceae bacterium]|nr:tRNA preQ1(34) S-adenosylmethionine ribosyltransferase-isomerase QueA [Acidimicrobiaceae bacterium]|tara:strand:- start:76 stop:1143 length:1068 start_codon:yes stop_codon:yes gene_type:complete